VASRVAGTTPLCWSVTCVCKVRWRRAMRVLWTTLRLLLYWWRRKLRNDSTSLHSLTLSVSKRTLFTSVTAFSYLLIHFTRCSGLELPVLAYMWFLHVVVCHTWVSNKCIAVRNVATPLRELTCHMGSHSVTCNPTEVKFPALPQPKLVLDLATLEGCKAELTWVWYI